jgi:hypothetical protein
LLANLGFWAWVHWVTPEPVPPEPYDGPRITLLRELPPDSPLRSPPPAVGEQPAADPAGAESDDTAAAPPAADSVPSSAAAFPAADEVSLRCIVLGPFAEPAAAGRVETRLAGEGIAAERFTAEGEIWDGYWVYIEQIDSRDRAREMLAELTGAGIEDAYVIPGSDSGILISLGVYSDITRAGAQTERVGRLGFKTTIAERTRTADAIWLKLSVSDSPTDVLAMVQEPGRINRLEQRDCDAATE